MISRPQAFAHSFNTAESPPRVASLIARGAILAFKSASTTLFKGLQSLCKSKFSSFLFAKLTAPCLPTSPLKRIFAPLFKFPTLDSLIISPIPEVLIKILSQLPLLTTLVSPQTMLTPASSAVLFILFKISLSSSIPSPSSIIKAQLIYLGFAPTIARSFIVPQTAILPISPPGNLVGLTTKLSVLNASFPLKFKIALSLLWAKISLSKILKINPFMSSFISCPPPP